MTSICEREKRVMKHGLPYQGSKNKIAKQIVDVLPPADVFVDVFAGGCAITHAAILSGKYGRIIANDITDAPTLFRDAAMGQYRDCDRWVSRDEFEMLKDADPFVRILWSFGNNQKTYLYSKETEEYKRRVHAMLFEPELTQRRIKYSAVVNELLKIVTLDYKSLDSLQSLERLQSLESLERLERLQSLESLERLERLTVVQGDYRNLKIPPPNGQSVIIYADPPYIGTAGYAPAGEFDHEEFYAWCRAQSVPVFVSEYQMPDDFREIARFQRIGTFSPDGHRAYAEKLYAMHYAGGPAQMELFDLEAER